MNITHIKVLVKEGIMAIRNNWKRKSPAPKATAALPITLAQWPRNEREVIRVTLTRYRGRISIDVRVWFRVEGGKLRPGRRGISLRLKEIANIRKELRKALKTAVELGLIK
jgi:transcriptional coactivator p15 (PC4)